jgi:STE24 endopeptidase
MIEIHLLFVGLLIGTRAFFTLLSMLNVRHADDTVAAERDWLTETLELDDPDRMLDYLRTRQGLENLQSWVTLGFVLVVLYSGLYRRAAEAVGTLDQGPVVEGTVFIVGAILAHTVLNLVFGIVGQFVVEEIFDFNEATVTEFLKNQAIGVVFTTVIFAALIAGLLGAIGALPQYWWLAGVGLFAAFILGQNLLHTRVILPLKYDTKQIDDGEPHDAVSEVFEGVGASCERVYEVETSSESSKLNAMFTGFGSSKRVFLYDTLIDELDTPQLKSVIAHELGHWKHRHVWKQVATGLAKAVVVLFALWYLLNTSWLYGMFGLPQESYVGLLTGFLWVSPLLGLTAPLDNRLSYSHEYEADAFAVDLTDDLDAELNVLRTLSEENLTNPFPHPWYAAFNHDHPPAPERMRHVREQSGD